MSRSCMTTSTGRMGRGDQGREGCTGRTQRPLLGGDGRAQNDHISDLPVWIHWSLSRQRARQLWTGYWNRWHITHLRDRNGADWGGDDKRCFCWDSGCPRTQKEAGRKSRLDAEPSQPKICALDEGQACKQKWEKWKSSSSRIVQQNNGRRQMMSWIRKNVRGPEVADVPLPRRASEPFS